MVVITLHPIASLYDCNHKKKFFFYIFLGRTRVPISLVSARMADILDWIPEDRTRWQSGEENLFHHDLDVDILQLHWLMTDVTFVAAIKILVHVRNRCVHN